MSQRRDAERADAPRPFANEDHFRRREPAASAATRQHLVFRIGTEDYGLDIRSLREIIRPRPPTEVPNAPSFVLGVVAVRGVVMPLIDLGARLRIGPVRSTPQTRSLVVEVDHELYALAVDEVAFVARIAEQKVEPPPVAIGGLGGDFVRGISRSGEQMIILLDIEALLRFEVPRARPRTPRVAP